MTYWSYNVDSRLFVLYSRHAENGILFQSQALDFAHAHDLAAAVDKIYEQGVAMGRLDVESKVRSVLQQKPEST